METTMIVVMLDTADARLMFSWQWR